MLSVPVVDKQGAAAGTMEIEPDALGGHVRSRLLKQAVVAYRSNRRQGSARTRGRSMVAGSSQKLYRQKGTGNARMGTIRTNIRRGGGVAFAKQAQNWHKDLPRKMRRLARNSAILAKITSDSALVVKDLQFDKPRTKDFAAMLKAIGADRGCVVVLSEPDDVTWLSGRNIPKTEVVAVQQLNAYEVLRRPKLVFSEAAFELLRKDPVKMAAGDTSESGEVA